MSDESIAIIGAVILFILGIALLIGESKTIAAGLRIGWTPIMLGIALLAVVVLVAVLAGEKGH